ncbi:acyl-CoA synthetase (AMP-forming)/AMP-acid ligase II [Streptomyces sp. Amel2xB2]|uniref:4-coumarate--CoA ligase family protein n=1 Tax=Streptomyces sp. Amel2xB2 TaxID=1305829 RepID=UPI000DBA9A58|nr:4-coumarate--CoA ligase family protein [Streptomyces sp. Amel2xB2]RAJ67046.1 acyl-CoA synthetase (AMP-forming)/AMP-acid ligase II [Streptomyces sp. Amel2xB2]
MIHHSQYADVPPVDEPIHDAVLGRSAVEFGDRAALVDGLDGSVLTYAQLDAFTRRIAAALAEAGLRKGDVLALHSPNTLVFPAVFHGATRAGAAVSTVHPLATAEELARQLRDSGARWLVTVSPLLETARQAAELCGYRPGGTGQGEGGIQEIFVCDEAEGYRSVLGMRESTAPEPHVEIDPARDLAALPYSSGTTSLPKGVMLTHRNIATNLAQLDPLMPAGPEDRLLAVLPFFHIYGLTALINAPLRKGAAVVVLPRFELGQFLAAIETHRVNVLYVAPPIVLALAKHPDVDKYDLSSLEFVLSAAAPLDAELAAACGERLNVPVVKQAYGMTELSPGTHVVPRYESAPPGAVGKLLPSTEMRVASLVDPGRDVPEGEEGELLFRGPQVMKGYLGRTGETDAMIDADGWLRTGDIGRVDADGWLYVVDRVKELIKYKGYQVAPAELEAVLLTHPALADAAVIGVPDESGNEVPKAFVVRQQGAAGEALTEDDVLAYVAERVAPYKKVRRVEFTQAVPRALSGKILRRELRAAEAEKG